MSKLLILDCNYYLHRNFHALPPKYSSSGLPIAALHGAVYSIRKTIRHVNPTHILAAFDIGGITARHRLLPTYKSGRPPTDPHLAAQLYPLIEVVTAMGLCVVALDGVEADDVIASAAFKAEHYGMTVVISTGDKDLCQCVTESTTLYNPFSKTNPITDEQGVQDKYGVMPFQFADYLALVGDSSDSISGVPGFGPKSAAKYLGEWGVLEELLKHNDLLVGKLGQVFRDNMETARLCRSLTTVRRDIRIGKTMSDLRVRKPLDSLPTLEAKYEFRPVKSLFNT